MGIFTSWYGMGDMGIGDDPAGADFAWMLAMLTFFTLVMYGALGREVAPNSDASEGE